MQTLFFKIIRRFLVFGTLGLQMLFHVIIMLLNNIILIYVLFLYFNNHSASVFVYKTG